MRLKFKMTPKEVAALRKTLKRTDSPNRHGNLMATNIAGPEELTRSSAKGGSRRQIKSRSKPEEQKVQSVSHRRELLLTKETLLSDPSMFNTSPRQSAKW